MTQNKIELRKQRVDPVAMARETADTFRESFTAAGLEFTMTGEAGRMQVYADPARLQQILTNLLGNATKYTPRGGKVSVAIDSEDGEAVIRIKDTGVGIPKDMLDPVFDLFVQASRTLDRAAGGIGVGLTLVRSLVAMHGGTVKAYSDGEGAGTEMIVRLPLASARDGVEEPRIDVVSGARSRVRLPRGAKIVVVEDNEDSRHMLCELLGMAGYECHTAGNGPAGLALIDQVNPNVAIVDIGLPGMDGYEMARNIRNNPRHAGVWLIALTGYGQAADRAASREAGFDEHMVKPVQTDDIMRYLDEMHGPRDGALDGAVVAEA